MTESDTFDRRLEEMLGGRSISSIDSGPILDQVVRRARRRIARRRFVTAAVVSGFFAAAVFVVIAAGPGHSSPAPVQEPTTTPTTELIPTPQPQTFAVFDRPPTLGSGGRKEWLALQFAGGRLVLYKQPSCDASTSSSTAETHDDCGEMLCTELNIVSAEAYLGRKANDCQLISTPLAITQAGAPAMTHWGSTNVEFLHGQPFLIYGVVPDVVTRVTYAGRDVPITNNAFLMIHPPPVADRSHGVPLYFQIGDCRWQADYSMTIDDGRPVWPGPFGKVTCGTTTTPGTSAP